MSAVKEIKSNWNDEISWLATNFSKFNVDDLKILVVGAKNKRMPEPAPNLGNVLRTAEKEGLIIGLNEYAKSKWRGSSRVPRQYWAKPKSYREVFNP
jgi:hypothetical protein